ncbi:MAG: Serine phosphatase RsbU, regulator of sigma subunit [uncultured Aureispira sp.]|uniref:Serine phosphatase RsbU, regulator of sigma subunit n=1 Tax=uncultured Aureispira sp. TaxID=1331704 RepID=A0A6S6UBF0_9BACT|nr:MAG: Serine phosphatase RsbU, regulator of sigma subunit [uncultured Aureispira sp.]
MDTSQNIKLKTREEILETKLTLQQLQFNRVLEITQAINDNIAIVDLFNLYKGLLTWEMGIKKFALYTHDDEVWTCVTSAGIEEKDLAVDLTTYLPQYQRRRYIDEPEHALLQHFSVVVPVYHKEYAIAYAFLGSEGVDDLGTQGYDPLTLISAITNIIAVAIENKRLFKRQLDQERLKREMELAVQVQNMLIPSELPNNERYEFSGIYQPHEGVGGDYYDFFEVGGGEVAFCIADISGKGIAAALLMSNFQANLQTLVHRKYLSVKKFANRLNSLVLRTTQGDKFITFFIARYHVRKKRLRYLCAGHNPPFMYTQGKIQRLDKGCTILGAFSKIPSIEFGEIFLEEDALFLLYTDGLTDLQNEDDAYFDDDKVEAFIKNNHDLSVKKFNDKLMKEVNEFKGPRSFPDDISVLTGRLFVNAKGIEEPTVKK